MRKEQQRKAPQNKDSFYLPSMHCQLCNMYQRCLDIIKTGPVDCDGSKNSISRSFTDEEKSCLLNK